MYIYCILCHYLIFNININFIKSGKYNPIFFLPFFFHSPILPLSLNFISNNYPIIPTVFIIKQQIFFICNSTNIIIVYYELSILFHDLPAYSLCQYHITLDSLLKTPLPRANSLQDTFAESPIHLIDQFIKNVFLRQAA